MIGLLSWIICIYNCDSVQIFCIYFNTELWCASICLASHITAFTQKRLWSLPSSKHWCFLRKCKSVHLRQDISISKPYCSQIYLQKCYITWFFSRYTRPFTGCLIFKKWLEWVSRNYKFLKYSYHGHFHKHLQMLLTFLTIIRYSFHAFTDCHLIYVNILFFFNVLYVFKCAFHYFIIYSLFSFPSE